MTLTDKEKLKAIQERIVHSTYDYEFVYGEIQSILNGESTSHLTKILEARDLLDEVLKYTHNQEVIKVNYSELMAIKKTLDSLYHE